MLFPACVLLARLFYAVPARRSCLAEVGRVEAVPAQMQMPFPQRASTHPPLQAIAQSDIIRHVMFHRNLTPNPVRRALQS
ncbi:hypothetical protein COCC4DRAFT_60983 [Bipolaris maydis ATCC 48331]|uniref:Secreted protein n=2 Tax=Cochliobolus heterostrophus TaxID=5016 RepID=M2SUU2_COCH5|nr:uncharacterized protein COCC4DRAFT_60983 [Bipolaris maydis ATCC 48331]EMD89130.1 hypothetical protein COCHEDRAFT_1157957 [Bipolaris maydis C5]ENI05150.1 hypothetical protein COCC4DRAFT_60983 [Bipolaris maydis ATCC 48331]KAJ6212500.1 hypothetical protein PSV09DRAFT_1157957 [Bipolaris maydis]